MDRHFYLSLESRLETQKDSPLIDVIRGFMEECADRHLLETKGWSGAAGGEKAKEEKEYFINDFQRRMSRWQHAVRAYFERVVVDADTGERGARSLGRSMGDIESALRWLDSDGDSFAGALVSDSIDKLAKPPCP